MIGYVVAAAAAMVTIAGDWFIKIAADRGGAQATLPMLAGAGLYAVSAVGWYFAMRHLSLAQIGVAFSVFTLLALAAMGAIFFGEKLGPREYLGIGAAMLAMILMARVG